MKESRLSLNARVVVGAILVVESLMMLAFGVFSLMIGGLVTALAFLAGAGGASEKQIATAFTVIALTLASPFVMALVLAVWGALVLLRRRRLLIVSAGILSITAQAALHLYAAEGFHAAELVPLAVHIVAIAVGIAFVPANPANTAGAPA